MVYLLFILKIFKYGNKATLIKNKCWIYIGTMFTLLYFINTLKIITKKIIAYKKILILIKLNIFNNISIYATNNSVIYLDMLQDKNVSLV
jgi:hypothetical protein